MATTQLIDRLLATPSFGERWARYWMDVARYADNKGYVFQEDREYPEAYKYRDWLVNAFNDDMPYDRFVTLQLAADLVGAEADLPALGFLTLGRRFLNNKHDIVDDRIDVVSRGLMAMTLGCARCHDHKYDPTTQADYYAMAGIFFNTLEPGDGPWPHRLIDAEKMQETHILLRGVAGNLGPKVERRFVSFLSPEARPFQNGSGRLELSQRIVDNRNPLTSRVMANRIWQHLSGVSLVESPSDFGLRCEPPQQLELLDFLACELAENGWSVKQLIRTIVTSRVYQQQSLFRADGEAVDPANSLLWRMNRRRLDFEAMRDTLLDRSGLLQTHMHGQPSDLSGEPFSYRRTLYSYIDRQNLPSIFRAFDMASPDTHSPNRPQTSTPQQGLYLLNSDFVAELSLHLAEQVEGQTLDSTSRAHWLFKEVIGRSPTELETSLMLEFIATQEDNAPVFSPERWICGYGELDPEKQILLNFERLPLFVDSKWQGGKSMPDAALGWCLLTAEGGHVGNDLRHAVVRRWIAPRSGMVRLQGTLKHDPTEGDGVRGTILHQATCLGQWEVKSGEQSTRTPEFHVSQGQTIDFVTDCMANESHDSFQWKVRIHYESFQSHLEHPRPRRAALTVWSQLAQALLISNETVHID
jgi:hypothetical protein